MRLEQLINSTTIEFPSIQTEPAYMETLKLRFTHYIDCISSLESSPLGDLVKNKLPEINMLCKALIDSVDHYLHGNVHLSYEKFKNGIASISNDFTKWYSIPIESSNDLVKNLYRIRTSNTIISRKNELFHIPFELRHLAATQRYSIPGLPCLYFGSSAYISWKELGEPSINSVYISRFETRHPIKVLNLGYNHKFVRSTVLESQGNGQPALISITKLPPENPLIDQVISWFVLFPLMIATSIKRQSPGSNFCDAYIVPQNLMQLVRNDAEYQIDGIRYISTKFNDEMDSLIAPLCWAFPIKTSHPKGYCPSLQRVFTNTVVQSWQFPEQFSGIDTTVIKTTNIEYMPGHPMPYNETIWGKSEAALHVIPATTI